MSINLRSGGTGNNTFDDLLNLCWSIQEAWPCIRKGPCSWCPVSSTCVPNLSKVHILAPISNPDICPHWQERWELRARPLGPHVSTITFLTCIVSVCTTLLTIGILASGIKLFGLIRNRWRKNEGWWKGWRLKLVDVTERTPLLE
ncbi:hypothetical protein B0O99DRAFT_498868 [Bisporella sp. PMI_857]|nr:hypothetical protein B0O99DRAFT_498868 [Bisporella sp. PMI_857]